MYYPYLRGKQFELIALREFAMMFPDNGKIVPIIEPIKLSLSGLIKAVEVMFKEKLMFALILNPNDGDFKREESNILSDIHILSENPNKWIPAFIYQENSDEILSCVNNQGLNNIMIIFKKEVELDGGLREFLSNSKIEYIVDGKPDARTFKRRLLDLGKKIIRLDDCFEERRRNVDYLNCLDEKFTEEHRFYLGDGFYGISDYTVLPSNFIDGGMLPYAVAIHLTYEKNKDEIFVHHFVSDTNDDQSNIQGKFAEATRKVKEFFSVREKKTNSIDELIMFLDENKYPGLGVIKKLSIKNHIELMNKILSE